MKLALTLLLIALTFACHSGNSAPGARDALQHSTAILNELVRANANPIPNALLNRTRCLVSVNVTSGSAFGVATCRYSDIGWTTPAFVAFTPTGSARRAAPQDVLLFLTTERAVQELMRGTLTVGRRPFSAPGLLVRQMPTVTDADLAADVFSYAYGPKGLAAAAVAGTLQPQQVATRDYYRDKLDFRAALNDRNPPSDATAEFVRAAESFFNIITPIGIIIHHSATLPEDSRPPQGEQEVDVFHRARGFEVICSGQMYHVAYHYLINPDGKVLAGRPEHCQGAHARGYNAYIGISVLGDFSSVDNPSGAKGLTRPTAAQMKALAELCARLVRAYHIPVQRILRHSDVARTRCPGDRFPFTALLHALEHAPS